MGDITLHYTISGAGFPLILLHGNGESSDYFKAQIAPFARCFRVVAVDTRGHGASPRGSAPFTLAQFAEDLKELMDSLEIKKADVLGFSDGANIALLFALKYPGYVEKLILNGANLFPSGIKLPVRIPIGAGHCLVSLIALFDGRAVRKKELLGLMTDQPDIRPEALAALSVPTLVIAGTRDMIKGSHTRLIADSIPGAELCFIEGDHFIAASNSRAFNRAALDFLQGS